MKGKKLATLISPVNSSFVRSDENIISEFYEVKKLIFKVKAKYWLPFALVKQWFDLISTLPKTEIVIVQFGGYWSVLPVILGKFFNKPVFIILHGTDCCSLPEVPYGSLRKKMIRVACHFSYKHATLLVPVSEKLAYVENSYNGSSLQGFKHYFPSVKTPFITISNGIDHKLWQPAAKPSRAKTFIAVFSEKQFLLKGGDLILEAAMHFTDCTFFIAGTKQPLFIEKIPSNLIFLGPLDQLQLERCFQETSFHLQLSLFEGFGMALCEAMLCGCVPIVSSVNMLPEIVGDTGFILKEKNINKLKEIIESAIEDPTLDTKRIKARERVIAKYSLIQRKKSLQNLLTSYNGF